MRIVVWSTVVVVIISALILFAPWLKATPKIDKHDGKVHAVQLMVEGCIHTIFMRTVDGKDQYAIIHDPATCNGNNSASDGNSVWKNYQFNNL